MVEISVADVRRLLDAACADPVLYIEETEGGPRLDVWTEALVSHHQIVVTREQVVEWLGADADDEEIGDALPELQRTIEALV